MSTKDKYKARSEFEGFQFKYLHKTDDGINLVINKIEGFDTCYNAICFAWTESDWDGGNKKYGTIFQANGFFDGTRHIDFGSDGYINYPNLPEISNMIALLAKHDSTMEDCDSSDYDYSNMHLIVRG